MNFVHPEFLWALSLLAIPVVIHLFNFKRYKTLYFSSLQFVKKVDQQTKSTQKLRHWLILLSRLLAFTFLVLAFAQPYFSDSEVTSEELTNVVPIYLDNSFSMEAKGADGQLLSQAKEKAKEVVEASDVNTLFLIGTNEMSGLEERFLNKAEAIQRIDEIDLSPISKSLPEVLNWQWDLLKKNGIIMKETDHLLFSDFQKSTSQEKIKENTEISVIPIRVKPESTANLSLDSIWFTSPIHRGNENAELNIRVKNFGETALENVELNIDLGNLKKRIYTNVEALSSSTTSLTYKEEGNGWQSGRVSVADEQIFFDNDLYISYEVSDQVNILIIDGEDRVDNFEIVFSLDNFYNSKTVNEKMITREDLSDKDLIILNGLNSITSGLTDDLVKLSSNGSTIALFPGSKADLASWNGLLSKLNLNRIEGIVSTGTRLDKLTYEDPFFLGVFDSRPTSINLPAISKAYIAGAGSASPLIKMKNGNSLFSYSKLPGTSFCFYSSLKEDFGQFVSDALFSTISLRLGETSKRQQPLFLTIGSDVSYPVYAANTSENAIKIKKDNFEAIPQNEDINNVRYIKIDQLSMTIPAGNYDVFQNKLLSSLSLNYDRSESLRTYYSNDELIALLGENTGKLSIQELSSTSQFNVKDVDKPFSYWKLCIILTLIFVLTEMAIVRFYK